MSRPSTIRKILAVRKRFDELISGRNPVDVYRQIAKEFDEDESTIAMKVACSGYYRCFSNEVEQCEKERLSKS